MCTALSYGNRDCRKDATDIQSRFAKSHFTNCNDICAVLPYWGVPLTALTLVLLELLEAHGRGKPLPVHDSERAAWCCA